MLPYALAGTLRQDLPLEGIRSKISDHYRSERHAEQDPKVILVTEATDVERGTEAVRFKLRWDQAVQREDEHGPVWGRNINHVNVTVRSLAGQRLVFIHGDSRLQCTESRGPTSRVLTDLNAQITPLEPGPQLFKWVEEADSAENLDAGILREKSTGIRRKRLSGDFSKDNPEWVRDKAGSSLVFIRYESKDGNVYGIYADGTYYGHGPHFGRDQLEQFVITKVIPHL